MAIHTPPAILRRIVPPPNLHGPAGKAPHSLPVHSVSTVFAAQARADGEAVVVGATRTAVAGVGVLAGDLTAAAAASVAAVVFADDNDG